MHKNLHDVTAHNDVLLKAESMADKVEWLNKLGNVVQPSKGGQLKGDPSMRQSLSDGSLVSNFFLMLVLYLRKFLVQLDSVTLSFL